MPAGLHAGPANTQLYPTRPERDELARLLEAPCACHERAQCTRHGRRSEKLRPETSAALVRPLLRHASASSADPSLCTLAEQSERIDVRRVSNWLRDQGARALDPRVGIRALAGLTRGTGGLVELAAECAPTLRDALLLLTRFSTLLGDHLTFHLHEQGERAAFCVQSSIPICQALRDYQLGALALAVQSWLACPGDLRLWFSSGAPTYAWEYRDRLKAQVGFDAPCDAVMFPRALLASALRRSDAALHGLLSRCTRRALDTFGAPQDLPGRISRMLPELLSSGAATMDAVAEKLELSPRTLSRHLEREGIAFSGLLDDVRQKRALYFLTATTLDVKRIAAQLGYSTQAAFTRAFIRWHGRPPCSYREAARQVSATLA